MAFNLTHEMIKGVARSGATYAEQLAPVIAAADEARRPDLLERAIAGLRRSLATVIAAMRDMGATDIDVREAEDAAAYSFSDRLAELLSS